MILDADAELRSTGLERTDSLTKDLAWFEAQGNIIPEPTSAGMDYVRYLEEISETDPQGFICHFYNVYFAHSAGGRMIGRKAMIKTSMHFYLLIAADVMFASMSLRIRITNLVLVNLV